MPMILLPVVLAAPSRAEDFTARVVNVRDGDSFVMEIVSSNMNQRRECTMRRYNAPRLNESISGRPDGRASLEKLSGLIENRKVHVRAKRGSKRRMFCDVWLMDGTNVNRVMRDYVTGSNDL